MIQMLRSSESLVGVFRFGAPAVAAGLACVILAACGGEDAGELAQFTFTSELVTEADAPAKLAVAPDGRIFYSEYRAGDIRIIDADGQPLEQPFAHVEVADFIHWGLFGLTFDPEFEKNHYVYAYLIRSIPGGGGQAMVIRFTDVDNTGTDPTAILDDLPRVSSDPATDHVGGGLLFGPDGYLYLSLGDFTPGAAEPVDSQDLGLLPGKILRVRADGSAIDDNPFVDTPDADPRIFAYGLRNVFDFTFHPVTGRIYANDNGLVNCDELNIVDGGENYGWPQSLNEEKCENPGAVEPIYLFSVPGKSPEDAFSNVGPTAIEFLTDDGDLLLTCDVNTGSMILFLLKGPDFGVVEETRVIGEDCTLDMARARDGTVYYSNHSEIRRLVPD
ncbi:MAG: PQQ-dependent sugar dehydrogenase [Chloroflexi bacterium]|nr:PQQ-dependent sugar dehydrogenase [Chloroflexota bacterium]